VEWHDLGGGGGTSMARLNLTEDELVSWVVSQLQLSGEGYLHSEAQPHRHQSI